MNGWLALPLTLLLGQAPAPSTPTPSPEQTQEQTDQELEVKRLQAELEVLRAQQEFQHQQQQSRIQSLEQQQATKDARAQQLEQLRQQRMASLQRGYDWLVTADQLLESGDFTVGPAIAYARREISTALANASETGRGEITGYLQSALNRLTLVEPMVARRDSYPARLQLQSAGTELNLAWQLSLQRSGTTLVNQ